MANRNRNRQRRNDAKNSEEFKKDVNRDVTQADQRESRNGKRNKKQQQSGTKGGPESGRAGYYSYRDNDFAWYNTKPELIQAAGNIAFPYWSGSLVDMPNKGKATFPGLLALDVVPTLGVELQSTDPVNIAAEKLWAYIFHTVSGQTFADAPDMMLYLLGMCDVFSYIVWLQRIYAETYMWSDSNTYMPEAYAAAERVTFKQIRKDRLRLWSHINTLIDQAATLCVPNQFTLFMRRAFMFQGIYSEGLSPKSQQYMFTPRGFLQYAINSTNNAGELRFIPLPDSSTVDQLYEYGENMINALLADQDVKKLSSLVLRAFGSDGIIKLAPMDVNARVSVAYSLEILEQIKNADIIPYAALNPTSLGVMQNPEQATIAYNVTVKPQASGSPWIYKVMETMGKRVKFLTTGVPVPTVPVVVENTRLKVRMGAFSPSTGGSIIPASEMCVGARVFTRNNADVIQPINFWSEIWYEQVSEMSDAYFNQIWPYFYEKMRVASCFKFMPAFYINPAYVAADESGDTTWFDSMNSMPVWDVDNWTVLSDSQLQLLNKNVMLSLLDNTAVAKAWNS